MLEVTNHLLFKIFDWFLSFIWIFVPSVRGCRPSSSKYLGTKLFKYISLSKINVVEILETLLESCIKYHSVT